jgi:two-component system, LuxR family, response regulator FixJ
MDIGFMNGKPIFYVVDDDPAVIRALMALLEAMGLVAEGFESAGDFLAAYKPDRPGCLILDMNMPDMNGLQLQKELKKRSQELPIIFITGYGIEQIEKEAIENGAVAVLEKPCRIAELFNAIRKAMG